MTPLNATMAAPRAEVSPESEARGLLQRAQGFLQKWPEGFRGYRARLRCDAADGPVEGDVVVACGREPVIELGSPGLQCRIRARILELIDERTPRFFKDGDGKFAVLPEEYAGGSAGSASSGRGASSATASTPAGGSARSSASTTSGRRSP